MNSSCPTLSNSENITATTTNAPGIAPHTIHLRRRMTRSPRRCMSSIPSGVAGGCQTATVSTNGNPPYFPNANQPPPTNKPAISGNNSCLDACKDEYTMVFPMMASPKTMHKYRAAFGAMGRLGYSLATIAVSRLRRSAASGETVTMRSTQVKVHCTSFFGLGCVIWRHDRHSEVQRSSPSQLTIVIDANTPTSMPRYSNMNGNSPRKVGASGGSWEVRSYRNLPTRLSPENAAIPATRPGIIDAPMTIGLALACCAVVKAIVKPRPNDVRDRRSYSVILPTLFIQFHLSALAWNFLIQQFSDAFQFVVFHVELLYA